MILNRKIQIKIEEKLSSKIISSKSLSGGCISNAYRIELQNGDNLLLKINEDSYSDLFEKEAHGLIELKKANAIKVPEVILFENNFIVLEFIESKSKSKNFFTDFGMKFAMLHNFHSEKFGFYENNYIGSNPQINIPDKNEEKNWTNFYFKNRILFQYKLAEKNGYATDELRKGISILENKIENILSGSSEPPSLLHGDLWSGNYMSDENGEACLIDPAVYYGHREADLAMTKLFGGFNREFYESYNNYFPLSEGYEFRENIYKLYHVLNHLNLFGHGYYSQALSLMRYYF